MHLLWNPCEGIPKAYCICGAMPSLPQLRTTPGSYLDGNNQRLYFTPEIKGVSTSQHMRHSIIRLSCYLAVVCGVSLRHIALLFSSLFLIPITTSSIKRWIDDIGSHLPPPEEMLRQLLAITP